MISLKESSSAVVSSYFACLLSFPFYYTVREVVEMWPKETNGETRFAGNYRQAAAWVLFPFWLQGLSTNPLLVYLDSGQLWETPFLNNLYPGFVNNYLWRHMPWMFMVFLD